MNDRPARRNAPAAPRALLVVLAATAFLVAACAAGGSGSASAIPSPTPGSSTISQEEAVALVLASDPQFAGVRPLDPDLIGQSAWYEVSPGTTGWRVTITKGWGDCQAGCIERHTWTYEVDGSGTVSLVGETGDPVPVLDGEGGAVPAEPPVAIPAEGGPWVTGVALAGPVCPVAQDPPDPSCADRPVAGAAIVVRDASGAVVARVSTGAAGAFLAPVPGAGAYTIEAEPREGLMGTPAPIGVRVGDLASDWAAVVVAFDTGIR